LFDRCEKLKKKIRGKKKVYLFIDYDGTLVSIKNTPMEAKAPKRAISLINEIAQNDNIIVTVVSGRKIDDLLYFLGKAVLEKINIVGSHGAQIKKAGLDIEVTEKARECMGAIAQVRTKLHQLLKDRECFLIEDKKVSFSVHYRRCKKKDVQYLDELVEETHRLIMGKPLEVYMGKKVVEIKPKGIDKSNAIDLFADNENPETLIICIGDDLTDEYLFKRNTRGINVKVKSSEDVFETSAEYYLKSVSDVHSFLKNIKELTCNEDITA
jgi:trehalose 6-phosphate phosphatase